LHFIGFGVFNTVNVVYQIFIEVENGFNHGEKVKVKPTKQNHDEDVEGQLRG